MRNNKKRFFVGVLVTLSALFLALMPLLAADKGGIVLGINPYRTNFADIFFAYFTEFGNGFWVFLMVFVFLFINYFDALIIAVSGIVHGLVVWSCKLWFFSDSVRPAKFFEDDTGIKFIEGFNHHMHHSFPSGHTATAFSLAVILMLLTRNMVLSVTLFVMAVLVGFSRMYLIQHFFIDVYAGAIIGSVSSIIVWHYMEHLRLRNAAPWMEKHRKLFPGNN